MTYKAGMLQVLAGATIGVLDTLGVAPSGTWNVRLFSSNPDIQVANDDTLPADRGYPVNNQILMPNDGAEVWVHNHDSNDGVLYALVTEIT